MTFCVVLHSLIYVQVYAYSKAVLLSLGMPQLWVHALVDHQPLYQVGTRLDPNISPAVESECVHTIAHCLSARNLYPSILKCCVHLLIS